MWILLLFFLIILVWTFWEPRTLQIDRRQYDLFPKDRAVKSHRLLFLSDLHVGKYSPWLRHEAKIQLLLELHQRAPFDAILVGGDFMDLEMRYLFRLDQYLRQLKRFNIPVLGVIGNHDYACGDLKLEKVEKVIRAAGVELLRNQVYTLGKLQIVGIDDLQLSPHYQDQDKNGHLTPLPPETLRARAKKIDWYANIKGLRDDRPIVMLAHNADSVYLPGEHRPNLVLAGHTHGGQSCFIDWLSQIAWRNSWVYNQTPVGSFQDKAGECKVDTSTLFISRGFGCARWPIRLHRSPQAHIIVIL